MTDDGPQGEPQISDRLLASSYSFARSAVAAYSAKSWDVFYLHLATAVEQLLKAVLARSHPSLIADTRADFDSLLHLCGLGKRARVPEFVRAVRTISVSEALKRVERLVDSYQQPTPRLLLLLDTRNAIVHSGHYEKGEAEAVLGDTAQYIEQLLKGLEITATTYWGDFTSLVLEHANRQLSAVEASYARRVQAARDRWAKLADSLSPAAMEAFVATAIPYAPRKTFDSALVTCPACENPGELTGIPDPQWEADWDYADGQSYLTGAYVGSIRLRGDGFRCHFCGLNLDPWQLPFAGMEYRMLQEEEFDITGATRFFEHEFTAGSRTDN